MSIQKIDSFRDEYFFLSNFYETDLDYEGIVYHSSEAAFQAQKCADRARREQFADLSPSQSKHRGREVSLRPDWEQVKVRVMKEIVFAKFSQNEELKEKLLATGNAYLEEGNEWGDRIWGTVDGKGQNLLGGILMQVREELGE